MSTPLALTLPQTFAALVGFCAKVVLTAAQTVTITANAADKINGGSLGGTATTSTAKIGMAIELVCTSVNNWTTTIINPGSGGAWAFT